MNNPLNKLCIPGLISFLLITTGCSLPVSLKYSPIASAETITSSSPPPRIFVVKFTDNRTKKDSIGKMNNAFGMKVKNLVTADDVGLLLSEATTDALRKSGLQAEQHTDRLTGEELPTEEVMQFDYIIGGRITDIEVLSQPGFSTLTASTRLVVDLLVCRMKPEFKCEWVGPIDGSSERKFLQTYSLSTELTECTDKAIQNCMRNAIRHLKASGLLQ